MDSSVAAAETNGFSREGTVAGDLSLSTSGALADFNKVMANAASRQLLEAWRNKNTTSNNSASSVSSAILPAPSRIKPVAYIMSKKTSSSRSLAFVYGTLKQGFSNHWLMEDVMTKGHARFVGIASTKKRYPLVCGPFQVPFLLDMPACGCHVRGELYEVDRVAIDHLDELEGVSKGHYVRRPLALTGLQSLQFFNYDPSGEIQAEAYFAAAPLTQGLAASSVHIEAYTKKQTVNYVPRKDRPQNRTFLEHVNAWIESQSQSVQMEVCSR
jgi:gamma-glutamylaminecyclotransferase